VNNELSTEQLRKNFKPDSLGIEDTDKLDHLIGIIGQDRAVKALEFGPHMKNSGYNIYVAGPPGIGKMTSVKASG
jgi:predicted ATPase with chaperone activity